MAYAPEYASEGTIVYHIDKVKNRIHLRSGSPTPGLHKTVPGANFCQGRPGVRPYWSMPLSMDACLALRERFEDMLEIGPDLWEWARTEKARRTHMSTLSTASDATLIRVPEVAPKLAEAMSKRTYQRVAARFVADGENVLLGDQPGLGKTLEALAGVIERGVPGPYLVICPKTAVETVWAREIPRWVPGARVVTVPDGRGMRDGILDDFLETWEWSQNPQAEYTGHLSNAWLVINPEMCRAKVFWVCAECGEQTPRKAGKKVLACGHDAKKSKTANEYTFPQLFNPMWAEIICDESDRSLLRQTGNLTQTRQGMELLRDEGSRPKDGHRMALSGTPFRGRPHLLWGTLNWLWPDRYPAMWSWCQNYWEVDTNGYGGAYTIGALRGDREKALWDSLTPVLLRRTKEEVAPDLPPKTYIGTPVIKGATPSVWLPMLPAQDKAYQQMLDSSVADLDGGSLSAIGILAETTRLKQFATTSGKMVKGVRQVACENPKCKQAAKTHKHPQEAMVFAPEFPSNKFEYLKDKLFEWGFPEDPWTKVIVVSQYTQTLELFAAEIARVSKIQSVMLTGNVTGGKRDSAVDLFNTEQGPHLMFLNTKAGGVAITIDTADIMVILDETWIPDDQEQVEDRIHRVSRPRRVEYHYLRSLGTIEEGIALVNAEREYNTKRLLDGRRGVEYQKRIMKVSREL